MVDMGEFGANMGGFATHSVARYTGVKMEGSDMRLLMGKTCVWLVVW